MINHPNPAPLAYRIPQAAVRLGLSVKTVERMVYAGEIPSFKIGGARLISATACDKLIADAMEVAAGCGAK